ncbi:hypothetical protein [Bradyrhizobium sp. LA6.12]|uniref:hypothetical protein n=1 Tax=unclassified Bradyrhizobium TaxID=2631580 RepID=UPI003392B218
MTLEPGPANPQPFSAGIHTQPPFDAIELLPPAAADKLRLLRQRSNDRHALIPPFSDVQEASAVRVAAQHELKRLTAHPSENGYNLPPDNRSVIAATKALEKATADFERLKQLQEVRSAAWQPASAALANVEDYLRHNVPANCRIEEIGTEPPKLAKTEHSLLDAIERLRRRARELKADLHRIRSAPFPSSYARQRMREQIEALAMQGAPSASSLIELDGGKIEFQARRLTSEVHAAERALAFAEVPDAVALIAWLHKDALIAALDREIAAEADDKAALDQEQREQMEATIIADALAIERSEVALIWHAEAQGEVIDFRSDTSALALLGLKLVTAPPSTSPVRFAGAR